MYCRLGMRRHLGVEKIMGGGGSQIRGKYLCQISYNDQGRLIGVKMDINSL